MPNIGMPELIVILVIVVLLFGTRKLPELGKGLGSGIRNFKNAMRSIDKDEELPEGRKPEQLANGSETTPQSSTSRTSFGNHV